MICLIIFRGPNSCPQEIDQDIKSTLMTVNPDQRNTLHEREGRRPCTELMTMNDAKGNR